MSFSLQQSLGVTSLSHELTAYLQEKCKTPEQSLEVLKKEPTILETIIAHIQISSSLQNLDKLLMSKVILIADSLSNEGWPVELLEKIKKISLTILYNEQVRMLSKAIHTYALEFNSKTPNVSKTHYQIQEAIISTFHQNPFIPFNLLFNHAVENIQVCFQSSEKFTPNRLEVIKKIVNQILDSVLCKGQSCKSSLGELLDQQKNIEENLKEVISSLEASLISSQKPFFQVFLTQYCEGKLEELEKKLTCENGEYSANAFADDLKKCLDLFSKVGVSSLSSFLGKFEVFFKLVTHRFFDKLHIAHASIHQEVSGENVEIKIEPYQKIIKIMNDYSSAHMLNHSLVSDFETKLFNEISSTYTLKVCQSVIKMNLYNQPTNSVISSLAELLTLIEKNSFSLLEFVETCEKIYLTLYINLTTLKTRQKVDFMFKTFLNILRGSLEIAVVKCQSNIASVYFDMNNKNERDLIKRLTILMAVFSQFIGGDIKVQITMRVKHDHLLALLYQIISTKYKSHPQTIPNIKQWIEKHPTPDFESFITWLTSKFSNKLSLNISSSPETLYQQFLKEIKL